MRSACLLAFLIAAPYVQAQPTRAVAADSAAGDTLAAPRYGTGAGVAILLTNSGFGLGGYATARVGPATSLVAELSLGGVRDERETKFFGIGGPTIQNKANYLMLVPLRLGVYQRLFRSAIEDNFRPYVHLSAGPTLGWVSPYFGDCNGNGRFDRIADCDGDGVLGWLHSIARAHVEVALAHRPKLIANALGPPPPMMIGGVGDCAGFGSAGDSLTW